MPAKRRRRSATSGFSAEVVELRKLQVLKEIAELLAEVVERQRVLGGGMMALPSASPVQMALSGNDVTRQTIQANQVENAMPRVTTSPTGCQICGNPYAVFTEVRPGLSQYLCQLHARERTLQRAGDAKAAAAGFSTDRTDARPQNIRLPEDNQRAKVLIHPTAMDMAATQQHAKDHPDVPDHVEFDETPEEA